MDIKNKVKESYSLSVIGSFEKVNFQREKRNDVIKVVNPNKWNVVYFKLAKFKDDIVNIKFSVDVKRIGATGELRWQINNSDYPTIGNVIENAETDIWYTMSGEWTGELINSRFFYLSTHNNNSNDTTFYIDNFNIEIKSIGKRKKPSMSHFNRELKDIAVYLKELIPVNIPDVYSINSVFKNITTDDKIRSSIIAYRDFMYLFCDRLISNSKLYDKNAKKTDGHLSLAIAFPFLNNVKNVLFNIGICGELTNNNNSLVLNDIKILTNTVSPEGKQRIEKLSAPKIIDALRFLTDCGFHFDGINLDEEKPDIMKTKLLEITYPDNLAVLTGLKVMAVAQKEFGSISNEEILLRCDYKVLIVEDTDIIELLNDYIYSLPENVKDFVLMFHQHYIDLGLLCKPKMSSLNVQFAYFRKSKEIFSFYNSLISGSQIMIKAQNTALYTNIIKDFTPFLQEKIANGYGCQKKRFDEPCQKGCHGFSLSLNESILDIKDDLIIWIDEELRCLKKSKNK